MIKLSVNLNKIALIRNSRDGNYPSATAFGQLCIDAGADGITVHPRPDQRHIRPGDVRDLSALVQKHPGLEFNIEGNPFAAARGSYPGLMALVEETLPHQCTLVPDSNDQLTSDHGFDLTRSAAALSPLIKALHNLGVRVSLFMDPDVEQIRLARDIGADRIELYTGPFAAAWGNSAELEPLFSRYRDAAQTALDIGLGVNAGHDLNLDNLGRFATVPGLLEVSIGHALTVDSLRMGMGNAVAAYKVILNQAR
ncbi:MAG: pyridoxamine 5'-phosphate oxidase [Gammaproteobacteria bacterium BRH_c0]|nr:MAG: pyridoxamine 5'-phosphate oxidase [Gammaproteobacteria bacterium BRH_c0]